MSGISMQRQVMVIGLGQFGRSLARALADRDVEVLAIDVVEERVQAVADQVAEAVCLDATDVDALQQTSPARRDFCVCAIGDEAREASIICTALLRQLGAPRVIARSNDDLHARILRLVGAHRVINPEHEFGERFASQLVHEGIKGELPLGEGVLISEIDTPARFVGKSLGELSLPRRYGVTVVAVRKRGTSKVILPDAATVVDAEDVIVVVAREGSVTRMLGVD
jgi:trk system potassium uptake protein TrkA